MNDDANDMFGMELMYQTTEAGLTTAGDVNYNGNISAVKWKGAGATSGATDQKSYKFSYDKSNRLTGATSQLYGGSAWNKEAGALNETMSYDYNGNILSLQRNQRKNLLLFDYTAENVDKLTYAYNPAMGDQLQQVTDAATGTAVAGFNNGTSGTANDYVYDSNGNVIKDLNKGISSIVYNHLGKPSTIIFSDGRHVDYVYDATGTKLTMKAYDASNVLQITTDYVNGFIYENNTLSFFTSPEGRVVDNSGTLEYQYIIKDHQGNTRVVFSSQTPAPLTPTATFESDSNDQSSEYLNAVTNVVPFGSANHTPGGSKVVRMNQTYKLGPAKSVSVFPGDKVDIEVWEYHESSSGFGTTSPQLTTLITNVAGMLGGVSGGIGEAGLKFTGVNSALTTFGTGGNQGDSRPAAYLNYILFDKNYNVLDAGFQPAPGTAMTKQKLSFNTLTIKEPGYVYAYLSYEDESNNWVYFDDFKVTHTKTNVIQYNEYYPYGLQANTSWTRDNNKNNFLYNEGSEINTTTGWYETMFRGYDASLGRFMQVDPLATKYASYNGYHYSFNNPVMFNDPSGADPNDGRPTSGDNSCGSCNFFAPGYTPRFWGDMTPSYFMNQQASKEMALIYANMAGSYGGSQYNGYISSITSGRRGVQNEKGEWGYYYQRVWATGINNVPTEVGVMAGPGMFIKCPECEPAEGTSSSWNKFKEGFMESGNNVVISNLSAGFGYVAEGTVKAIRNEARYTSQFSKLRGLATASKAVSRVGGVFGAASSVIEAFEDGFDENGFTVGDKTKLAIGLVSTAGILLGGPVVVGGLVLYGIADFGLELFTGSGITDRIGSGIDNMIKP